VDFGLVLRRPIETARLIRSWQLIARQIGPGIASGQPTIRPEGAKGGSFTRGGQASARRAAGTCIGTMKLLARR
jgi:hypothetical protein